MNVYTCSYNEYRPEMGVAVRISAGVPSYQIPEFNPFRHVLAATPTREYLHTDMENYDRHFYAQLDQHGVEAFRADFQRVRKEAGVKKNHPIVLLCFEKLGKLECNEEHEIETAEEGWCHRRKFASWWKQQTGEDIPELGTRAKLKLQHELF